MRARRQRIGMSQAELGRAVGVTGQQIYKYEVGSSRVSAVKLWGIAEVLGVSVSHFFEDLAGRGAMTSSAEVSPKFDHRMSNLVRNFAELSEDRQVAVLAAVESMAQGT